MNAMILACVVAAITAQTPIEPERSAPPRSERVRSDATITANLNASYLLSDRLNPFNISISTDGGVVTLGGAVETDFHKQLAEDLALGTQGVSGVVNNIMVMPTAFSEKDRRNFREKVRDKRITAAIRSRFIWHRVPSKFKVGIRTINGAVTLHGVVETEEAVEKAEEVAFETKGVEVVNNQLIAVRPDDATIGQNFKRQFTEEWYESRVRSAIMANRHVNIRDVKVEVQDGICYMTGQVNTEEERRLAEEIALGVQGIGTVDNQITLYEDVIRIGEDGTATGQLTEPLPDLSETEAPEYESTGNADPVPSVEATELAEP